MGLLYDALVRRLARRLPLIPRYKRSGHSVVIASPREGDDPERLRRNSQMLANLRNAYKSDLFGVVPNLSLPFQEGVFLKLDLVDGRWWCGFEPYTFVQVPRPEEPQDGDPERSEASTADPMGVRPERHGDPAGDWRPRGLGATVQPQLGGDYRRLGTAPHQRHQQDETRRLGWRTPLGSTPYSRSRLSRAGADPATTTSTSIGRRDERSRFADEAAAFHAAGRA